MDLTALLLVVSAAVLPGEDLYLQARASEASGRYGDAVRLYNACIELDGPLRSYAQIRSAVSRSRAGDTDGAISLLEYVAGAGPAGPWTQLAETRLAELLEREGRHTEAVVRFRSGLESPYSVWWLDDYRWQAATAAVRVPGEEEAGLAYFRDAAQRHFYRSKRLEAAEFLAASPLLTDRISAAQAALDAGYPAESRAIFLDIDRSSLADSDLDAQWQILQARLLAADNQRTQSRSVLRTIAEERERTEWAALARKLLIDDSLRSNRYAQAEAIMAELIVYHPESEHTRRSRWNLGMAYARSQDAINAAHHWRALAESPADDGRAAEALFELGHLHRRSGRLEDAVAAYDDLARRFAASDRVAEAAFWAGAIFEEVHQEGPAVERYQRAAQHGITNYYGHRAQEALARLEVDGARDTRRLRIDGRNSFVRPIPRDHSSYVAALPTMDRDERFARLEFFASHGFEEAEWEALGLARTLVEVADPPGALRIYLAMGEAGIAYTAMQIADANQLGENGDGTQTTERLWIRFPRAYWSTVSAIADDLDLDPYLILSISRQESTYRPGLTSVAGARGVMQLMPDTARWLTGVDDRIGPQHASQLDDPRSSILLGSHYIKRMLERYNGNVVYALAAYNAGPGNCDRWIRAYRGSDLDDFVESIPFSETRNYVKRVLAFYATYHSIYPPP